MTGESTDVEHVNLPTAGVSIHGLENQQIGKHRCASGGTDRGGENKGARLWPQTADSGHMRGEYYVFPATAVQKPWPKQRHGHN